MIIVSTYLSDYLRMFPSNLSTSPRPSRMWTHAIHGTGKMLHIIRDNLATFEAISLTSN